MLIDKKILNSVYTIFPVVGGLNQKCVYIHHTLPEILITDACLNVTPKVFCWYLIFSNNTLFLLCNYKQNLRVTFKIVGNILKVKVINQASKSRW